MKLVAIISIGTVTVSSDQPASAPAVNLLSRLMTAYNTHDIDTVAALYAPEGTHRDMASGQPKTGGTDIAAGLARFLENLPQARWHVDTITGGAGVASCEYVMTGSLQRDMGPFKASGQSVALPGAFFIAVRNGVIDASRDYWDSKSFVRQLQADVG